MGPRELGGTEILYKPCISNKQGAGPGEARQEKKKKKHQEKGEEPKKAGQLPVPGPGQAAQASDYLLQP